MTYARIAPLLLLVALPVMTGCGRAEPAATDARARISEERIKAALVKAFSEDSTLGVARSLFGGVEAVGPVFIDGPNATATFTMKSATGTGHTGECRMSLSQDGHWHLVYVNVPEIKDAYARCNYLIE